MNVHYAIFWNGQLCRCTIKQYLPPSEHPTVRRCRYDSREYVTTCPEHTKHWDIADKCENAPASFVYDGGTLQQVVKKLYSFDTSVATYGYVGVGRSSILSYNPDKKYRNSYCASCHGVAWLGCHLKPTFIANEQSAKLYIQYSSGASKLQFIYQLDFNKRSCQRDSDATILFSNFETGYDTCKSISTTLKKCDCNSILDLETDACVPIPYKNTHCLQKTYPREAFEISLYAKKTAT